MISYEATLICDECGAMMNGITATHPMHTRRSAISKAKARGWKLNGSTLCNNCKPKTTEQTNETSGEGQK